MNCRTKEMTAYFRSAVAAQSNMRIDFKNDNFYILSSEELEYGKINSNVCRTIFSENKNSSIDSRRTSSINVIICAKTIKTIFDANVKIQDAIEELTGVFYIPAILNNEGVLLYNYSDKKLPWFPREYLQKMVEPKLAEGKRKRR